MKKILGCFLVLVFVVNSYSAPLIFKIKKELLDEKETELASLETSKYKQIRVVLQYENKEQVNKGQPLYSLIFRILAVESEEVLLFDDLVKIDHYYSTAKGVYFNKTYESPPAFLKFNVSKKGSYWLYVWGTQ